MSSTSGISSASELFTGASRYSSDFQSIIARSVAIYGLHLAQLEDDKTALESESTALGGLNTKFTDLQTAITSLETGTGLSSYTASVSNGSIVSASVGTGAIEGRYTIEVTSLGSYTNTLSKDALPTVDDPAAESISSAASFTLTIDGVETTITPASNTLNALVEAINDADLEVDASIVNIGTTAAPDYRLTIQSTEYDAVTIQLSDGANLLDTLATGANASYKVNGMTTAVTSDTRTITLAPGLTVTLLAQSTVGDQTTITVSRNTTAISNALTSLVSAYNAALTELDEHRGEADGALSGQSLVLTLADALRSLSQYAGSSGTITSLTDLGLTFDDDGTLSFDTATFATATGDDMDDLLTFLGSSTGSGFLKSATDILDGLQDSTDGVLTLAIDSMADQIDAQEDLITNEEERVESYQDALIARMAAADALVARLEQSALYMSNLFLSMRIASESL